MTIWITGVVAVGTLSMAALASLLRARTPLYCSAGGTRHSWLSDHGAFMLCPPGDIQRLPGDDICRGLYGTMYRLERHCMDCGYREYLKDEQDWTAVPSPLQHLRHPLPARNPC